MHLFIKCFSQSLPFYVCFVTSKSKCMYSYMSRDMRKLDFCICKNKNADQLRGNGEADQRLCFRYTDSTISLLPKSKISNLSLYSVIAQPGLCQTWSETPKTGFLTSRLNRNGNGCYLSLFIALYIQKTFLIIGEMNSYILRTGFAIQIVYPFYHCEMPGLS